MQAIPFLEARAEYRKFIDLCKDETHSFRLTPNSESSPYALCFAVFGLHLLQDEATLKANADIWDKIIRDNLRKHRQNGKSVESLMFDKPYLQLLTFSLSALFILGTLDSSPLASEVEEMLPENLEQALYQCGALDGLPRSGNQAMFMAILMVHARDYLNLDVQSDIDKWLELHLKFMNKYGFWGKEGSMSHLQFQNGYHQYEVFEVLNADVPQWTLAADNVASLADPDGHFAPYPGGGGCYDYDATFILTGEHNNHLERHKSLLLKTQSTLLAEQNPDGGFAESHYVRPVSLNNLWKSVKHVIHGKGKARYERARYGLTLLRPANERIHTHWSQYSRAWNESDLWDSWFRLLTIAKIDVALNPQNIKYWGFINYPGIGYHRQSQPSAKL